MNTSSELVVFIERMELFFQVLKDFPNTIISSLDLFCKAVAFLSRDSDCDCCKCCMKWRLRIRNKTLVGGFDAHALQPFISNIINYLTYVESALAVWPGSCEALGRSGLTLRPDSLCPPSSGWWFPLPSSIGGGCLMLPVTFRFRAWLDHQAVQSMGSISNSTGFFERNTGFPYLSSQEIISLLYETNYER